MFVKSTDDIMSVCCVMMPWLRAFKIQVYCTEVQDGVCSGGHFEVRAFA